MNDADKTPEEIEAEIEETRDELGDTVAELADKADVKKQAGKKVSQAKDKAAEKIKSAAPNSADPRDGTGGDAGSGPTGDVRNSPGIVESDNGFAVPAVVAGAFLAGLLLGRIIWR